MRQLPRDIPADQVGTRAQHLPDRGWFLFSALASLVLGLLIPFHWPSSSAWAMGALLGVAVLINGVTPVAVSAIVSSELRSLAPRARAA